jgi:hypothetical protein
LSAFTLEQAGSPQAVRPCVPPEIDWLDCEHRPKIAVDGVLDLLTDPNDDAIARTIPQRAESLDLNVVAEGGGNRRPDATPAGHGLQSLPGATCSGDLRPSDLTPRSCHE